MLMVRNVNASDTGHYPTPKAEYIVDRHKARSGYMAAVIVHNKSWLANLASLTFFFKYQP